MGDQIDNDEFNYSAISALVADLAEAECALKTDDVNIFEILNLQKSETRHSNFLAWLLDPNGTHGLNNRVLQEFLMLTLENSDLTPKDKTKVMLSDLSNVLVEREKRLPDINDGNRNDGYLDILITSSDFVLCIENKIDSLEGKDQLASYYKELNNKTKKDNRILLCVYLTKNGIDAEKKADKNHWVSLGYESILYDVLEPVRKSSELNDLVASLIDQYIQILKRYIVDNREVIDLCRRIYQKHQSILDVIFENKPDAASEIAQTVANELADGYKQGAYHQLDSFSEEQCSPKTVRFLTQNVQKLHPLLAQQNGKEITWSRIKTNTFWFFEIIFRENKARDVEYNLVFTLNNQNDKLTQEPEGKKLSKIIKDNGGREITNWPKVDLIKRKKIPISNFESNPKEVAEKIIKNCFQKIEDPEGNWKDVLESLKALKCTH